MKKRKFKKKSAPKIRRKAPHIKETGAGIEIHCPFCHPPHVLRIDMPSPCGTVLELKAVQNLFQDIACALCGGKQGTLVRIGERYKHVHDCSPGKHLYTVPPEQSRSARWFWLLPEFLHRFVWTRLGKKVIELSSGGTVTGYAWDKV